MDCPRLGLCLFSPDIGLEVSDISHEEIKAIKAEAENASQNTGAEYMINPHYDRPNHIGDGDIIGQKHKYLGQHWKQNGTFIGDIEKVRKGSKYSNLPVRKDFD